jgi:hypothetical protein
MTKPASILIQSVQTELQDPEGIRWPAAELVSHLNEALLNLITHRPDAKVVFEAFTPVVGARQTLPSYASTLIDVAGNTSGRKRNITKVDKSKLDAVSPNWQGMRPVGEIIHFSYDLVDPRCFYLYPPAQATASIDLVFGGYPTSVAPPSTSVWTSVAGMLDVKDEFFVALLHYVLFKAFSKDAEFGGNTMLAAAHHSLYEKELGIQRQSATAVAPTK